MPKRVATLAKRVIAKTAGTLMTTNEPTASTAVATSRRPAQEEIRTLAYAKWVDAGRPPGDGAHFWLEAERELSQYR
jgi:hypothetical protein